MMEQIELLKNQINEEIQRTEEKTDKTIRDRLVVAALKGDRKRLEQIESILKIEKYDLVFIGQQGVGKTTAICHLFGLTTHKVVKTKKGGNTIERTVVQELLATGSGKTTLCEVAIVPDDTTFIEVTPIEKEDLEQLIDDFCLFQWDKWQQKHEYSNFPVEPEGDQTGGETISTEFMRAVRNMAGLSDSELDELLKKFEEYKDFYTEILKRSRISERTETRITPSSEEDEKSWIRKTFNSLNYCKLENFSVPKRINIHINKALLNLDDFLNINSIIDTKGIGAGEVRKDIDNYFRSKKDAFCLLVERFPSVPTNVIDLMRRHLTPESQDISSKVSLFVIPRKDEPEQTSGADGTRAGGITYRKRDIEDILTSQKISFSQANILFHDPLEYYISEKGLAEERGFKADPDYGDEFEELVATERKRVLSEIHGFIEKRQRILVAELEKLEQHLAEIKRGKGIEEQDEQLLHEMKDKIIAEYKSLPTRERDATDFIKQYVNQEIVKRNHMIVRATNSRYGRYDVRNIDIYYAAVPIAEYLLEEIIWQRKEEIIEIIKLGIESASPNLQVIIEGLEGQINAEYDALVKKFASDISDYLEETTLFPQNHTNEFWQGVQNRWGQGPGYKADVVTMYHNQLDRMKSYLQTEMKSRWRNFVEEKVLAFL